MEIQNPKSKIQNGSRGQHTIEYAVLIVVAMAAILGMTLVVKRALSGRWRGVGDAFGYGRQYVVGTAPPTPGGRSGPPVSVTVQALPKEDHQAFATCGAGQYELARWCEGDCGDDDAKVTLCATGDEVRCDALTREDRQPFASCGAGQYELARWCEGDCSGDDAKETLCCTGARLRCRAIPRENHQQFATCGPGETDLVHWCSGDCSGDDAKVTICCAG